MTHSSATTWRKQAPQSLTPTPTTTYCKTRATPCATSTKAKVWLHRLWRYSSCTAFVKSCHHWKLLGFWLVGRRVGLRGPCTKWKFVRRFMRGFWGTLFGFGGGSRAFLIVSSSLCRVGTLSARGMLSTWRSRLWRSGHHGKAVKGMSHRFLASISTT